MQTYLLYWWITFREYSPVRTTQINQISNQSSELSGQCDMLSVSWHSTVWCGTRMFRKNPLIDQSTHRDSTGRNMLYVGLVKKIVHIKYERYDRVPELLVENNQQYWTLFLKLQADSKYPYAFPQPVCWYLCRNCNMMVSVCKSNSFDVVILFISFVWIYRICCRTVKKTHFDASSTSVALILTPSPESKVVSLPTTTTPPFIVPKAGRQRRVTVEGGGDDQSLQSSFCSTSIETCGHSSLMCGWKLSTENILTYRLCWASTGLDTSHPSGSQEDSAESKAAFHVIFYIFLILYVYNVNSQIIYQFSKVYSFLAEFFVVFMVFCVA